MRPFRPSKLLRSVISKEDLSAQSDVNKTLDTSHISQQEEIEGTDEQLAGGGDDAASQYSVGSSSVSKDTVLFVGSPASSTHRHRPSSDTKNTVSSVSVQKNIARIDTGEQYLNDVYSYNNHVEDINYHASSHLRAPQVLPNHSASQRPPSADEYTPRHQAAGPAEGQGEAEQTSDFFDDSTIKQDSDTSELAAGQHPLAGSSQWHQLVANQQLEYYQQQAEIQEEILRCHPSRTPISPRHRSKKPKKLKLTNAEFEDMYARAAVPQRDEMVPPRRKGHGIRHWLGAWESQEAEQPGRTEDIGIDRWVVHSPGSDDHYVLKHFISLILHESIIALRGFSELSMEFENPFGNFLKF